MGTSMARNRVLIVDDNQVNTKLVSVTLDLAGYEVRTAGDAQEALSVLESFEPVLILMDIQLPGMDGLELTRRLKADSRYSRTVILAITSYAMKGDEERVLNAGCDGYIAKPIDTRTFANVVASYLTAGHGSNGGPALGGGA